MQELFYLTGSVKSRMLKWKIITPLFFVGIIGLGIWWFGSEGDVEYTTFTVRQGPLDIKVLEGGNLEALENQEVKSQVKGWQGTKILSIVDEGIFITVEEVANKKVLVELDSSELNDKLISSQISFKGTEASLTTARKGLDIQVNQSVSDIYASELEMKFAKLEMEKYLDTKVTKLVIMAIEKADAKNKASKVKQDIEVKPVLDSPEPSTEADVSAEEESPVNEDTDSPKQNGPAEINLNDLRMGHPKITFSDFVDKEMLGDGAANQELSKLTSEAFLSEEDFEKAKTDFAGKERLHKKKYITDQELKSAEIAVNRQEASVKASQKALEIFKNYEFPKQAEKLMSGFIQAKRKLERTEQQSLSEIAKAKATLASAEARYKIEQDQIAEYEKQIKYCVMVAEQPGLVVYGGSDKGRYWNEEPIKAGSTIRERQTIITIPDMSSMAVKVDIHESDIKKIKVGQAAIIRVDAFPDRKMEGEVTKVAVLPSSQSRWMNPDLKVYETTIKVDGSREWVKPGMSAEVEIMVNHIENATYIPLQSIVPQKGKKVCFVIEGGNPVVREVETGEITVEYVTITKGLEKSEKVLIRPPEGSRDDNEEDDFSEEEVSDDSEESSKEESEEGEVPVEATTIDKTVEQSKAPTDTNKGD
jgi:HlyD family secretion protein